MTHKAGGHVWVGKARAGWRWGHRKSGHGVPGFTAHLGLGALQLTTSPLPGNHFLFHLLPKSGCLGLQGTHTGPQGQLCPGLLLQQFLWVEGMVGVRSSQRQGRGRQWGDEQGHLGVVQLGLCTAQLLAQPDGLGLRLAQCRGHAFKFSL